MTAWPEVHKFAAVIPVSAAMAQDALTWQRIYDDMAGDMAYALKCAEDARQGRPHLGPGRTEYNRIMAPIRKRRRIRNNLEPIISTHRPGPFIRATVV